MKAGLRNPYKITIKVEEKHTNKTQIVPATYAHKINTKAHINHNIIG